MADVACAGEAPASGNRLAEDYVRVTMPPGFRIIATDFEGPVIADARGMTLYTWPTRIAGSGTAGDPRDRSECDDKRLTTTAGLASPYPPDLGLPDIDTRRDCVTAWPPVLADADARPIGSWTIFTRADGRRQWAYGHQAVYTSAADRAPGDVLGGTAISNPRNEIMFVSPATRQPVSAPPAVPPGFKVETTPRGRMVLTDKDYPLYTSDSDGPNKSNCYDGCAQRWQPALAAEAAQPLGEWSIVLRAPGVRQWAFRKRPLYTFAEEGESRLLDGSDVPGWKTVYTQLVPPPPKGFTEQATANGDVLADSRGKTIYVYRCIEDATDQALCDTLDDTQVYRLAICGGGNAARCQATWPYVIAAANATSDSQIWSIVAIDPATGRRADPGQTSALRVWAYRGRPVYTHAGDKAPGDFDGDATGEWMGYWNGYRAFWLRDQFSNRGG